MKHYLLLRLAPGVDAEAVQLRVKKTYEQLDRELDWMNHPVVYRGCVSRETNADIMAVAELDTVEHLQDYLAHPLHIQMTQDLKDAVIARTTFDHY